MRLSSYLLICSLFISSLTQGQSNIQKGISLYQSKKWDEAILSFKMVEKTSSDYGTAQYYLGKIAYTKKEYDDAVDYFKAATEKTPTNGEYFNWLGDAYSGVGSDASFFTQMSVGPKALKAWEKAAQLNPKIINARVSLVDSYFVAPEFMGGGENKAKAVAKEVLPLLEESIKTTPENFLHQYWYGKITALTGINMERGEAFLLNYLKHIPTKEEPSHAGANMRLGQIKEKQGNKVEAKRYYETALKLDGKLEGPKKDWIEFQSSCQKSFMDIEFRLAAPEDWDIIQSMAHTIWPVTYGHLLPAGQLEYMLDLIFCKDSIKQQMDQRHQFIIGHNAGVPLGFASFEKQYKTPSNLMIHKLYVLPSFQAKGIGTQFLNYLTRLATQTAQNTVMLKVFVKNLNAIRFYKHLGFHSIGMEVTELGRGYTVTDYVMIKEM